MEKKQIKINGKIAVEIKINGGLFWKAGEPVEDWKLDEDGYLIGADGKYYERWYDDSHTVDNNPIADLNSQWVEDTVSGGLNIDKNFDYFMSNSNYHVGNSYAQFKVSWSGLTHIDFLYRSYAESTYDYLVINGLDKNKFTSQPSYSTSGILAHTRGKQTTTYNTLSIDCDEGEHFIWFCYIKDGSADTNPDRAFVGIPNNYKSGEIFEKQGEELHYQYIKSFDYIIPREGYIQFKYYKTYYSPNGLNSFKTSEYILGEEVPATPITDNYLRFDATTNDVTISFNNLALATDMEYAIDFEQTWKPFTYDILLKQGQSMYVRANGLSTNSSERYFTTSNYVECHGDVRSLLSKTNFENADLKNYCFRGLFKNSLITTIPELNATNLAANCYSNMFGGCTSLTSAPKLPATNLASYCYSNMFNGCTALTSIPENMLSATNLAANCCEYMFRGCTALTSIPENMLPATNLVSSCYSGLFYGCIGLTEIPEKLLPATNLASFCYSNMFNGCTKLTTAPELPATNLASYCYYYMFSGCTKLTTAPELPATNLESECYQNMFNDCTSLNKVKCMAMYNSVGDELTSNISYNFLNNVSSNGTFYKNPNWSGPTTRAGNTIPARWTIVDWTDAA